MTEMAMTKDQEIIALKDRYPRCPCIQGMSDVDVEMMVMYYCDNEHVREGAPLPSSVDGDLKLREEIFGVLRPRRRFGKGSVRVRFPPTSAF